MHRFSSSYNFAMSLQSAVRFFSSRTTQSPRWILQAFYRTSRPCTYPAVSNQGQRRTLRQQQKCFSSMNPNEFIATSLVDSITFEAVCSDTLESLCDYLEQLVEEANYLKNADITYGDGVLTVNFGEPHGTYVINRQSPNRQIWLSSPISGPKRYDFIPDKSTINEGYWVYKHDGVSLHELLQKEIEKIVKEEVDFFSLPHSRRNK
ncbi:frataxin homolog, mitochondrial [Malaya genurostris]|uniref:frataxin homolog, mitochondrial n=1 Tax=Malaya genurostris TaxID=325434 RepID=UPI0026F3A1E6|nr:frataxin homolog, mitochondrial [Malaya genurostris]